jgi:hypothetical protein
MKPGAIITPKSNDPAKAKFYVRSKTRNGWVRCLGIDRHNGTPEVREDGYVFKFRVGEMEVVG